MYAWYTCIACLATSTFQLTFHRPNANGFLIEFKLDTIKITIQIMIWVFPMASNLLNKESERQFYGTSGEKVLLFWKGPTN